jgi:hypothetical protein
VGAHHPRLPRGLRPLAGGLPPAAAGGHHGRAALRPNGAAAHVLLRHELARRRGLLRPGPRAAPGQGSRRRASTPRRSCVGSGAWASVGCRVSCRSG